MKQTAVQWLVEQLPIRIVNSYQSEIVKVLEMEKQQIEDAFYTEQIDEFGDEVTFEDYYNETFNKS